MMENQVSQSNGRQWQIIPPLMTGSVDEQRAGASRCGTLMLDQAGAVCFGDTVAADLFRCAPGELPGRQIAELLPVLALQPEFKGYNVAFVGFRFARGQWYRFNIKNNDGISFDIGLNVVLLKGNGASPFFQVQICPFEE